MTPNPDHDPADIVPMGTPSDAITWASLDDVQQVHETQIGEWLVALSEHTGVPVDVIIGTEAEVYLDDLDLTDAEAQALIAWIQSGESPDTGPGPAAQ